MKRPSSCASTTQVRQAGQVQQASLNLKLINDGRHADLGITLSGEAELDRQRLANGLQQLRETLPLLPPDPYLLLNPDAWHNHNEQLRPLPELAQVLDDISQAADGVDLVGFYAAGPISRGFASSTGAFGWHRLTASISTSACSTPMAKRSKPATPGIPEQRRIRRPFPTGPEQLAFLDRPLHNLAPGQYRAYLAPAALEEIISIITWGGFRPRPSPAKAVRCNACTRVISH